MFTISSALNTVRKWQLLIQNRSAGAYFHIPIHPSSRKYLRFAFVNKVFQFRVLPFCLNTAPQVMTHLGHTIWLPPLSGDFGYSIPRRLVSSPFKPSSSTLPSVSAAEYSRAVGYCSDKKKSELYQVQDIQFLGVHLRLDLGRAFRPESKAREIIARACELSSQRVLSYQRVAQFMDSLNWALGLIPLGHLHLRLLQRHFHSLDLMNWFTPLLRSHQPALASLLQKWQDLSFLTSGIPI